jgi:hypothetical protein
VSLFLLELPGNKAAPREDGAFGCCARIKKTRGRGFLKRKISGFTLIEIMAAVVVFFIIMAMLAQMTRDTTALVRRSNKEMDGDVQARQVFSLMARDLAGMPNRLDMDYSLFKHKGFTLPARYKGIEVAANLMPGNDSLAFVSNDSGSGAAGGSGMSLIVYKIGFYSGFNGPVLQRLKLPLAWEPETGTGGPIYLPNTILGRVPDVFTRADDYGTVGEHVFRVEYQYWLRADSAHPGGMSVTPYRSGPAVDAPLRQAGSLVVTVAVLDAESRKICGSLEALIQSLPDAVDGEDTAEAWNNIVQNPGFAVMAQIPQAAASGVRIYQRFLNLSDLE